ncbi:MAG: hypothetical protein IJF05_06360 [Clostridia bacterium]|nr:hypothetical protein [Clostridia bacterium]
MKKIVSLIMALTLIVSACVVFSSCDKEITYTAASEFYYSADKGATYGNRTKEYAVGETVYMQVIVKVVSDSKDPEDVKVKLTIPNVTAVDAKYYDGQIITPVYDAVQNVTTYEFTITASKDAVEWNFVFQFVPNAEAEVAMTLEFDDKIDSKYDRQNTVKFVPEGTITDWE